ncbi:hypothetical protein J4228_03185 [Candidatus Woesearchaeota archaeon]|nr:hypothetical protein [Candidatus Woesearchaeota archaeon]
MSLEEANLELGLTGLEGLARDYLDTSRLVKEHTGSDSLTRRGVQFQVTEDRIDLLRKCYGLTQEKLPDEYANLRRLADKMYNELERVLVPKK